MYERSLKPGSIAHAYYHKVTAREPVGFDRVFVDEADVYDVNFSACADLTMVAALPVAFAQGDSTLLVSKADVDGDLEIAVYDALGERLTGLFDNGMTGGQDGVKGVFVMSWDATNARGKPVEPGRYVIRWTLNGAFREMAVWIEEE